MKIGKKKTILIVEDEENHILIIRKAMEAIRDINCELLVAYDGEEVMQFLNSPTLPLPDLILMDIKLPKKNGFELLQEIRQQPRLKIIPIIIFTSSNRQQDVQRCYELGGNSYIIKPMNFEEFKQIIFNIHKYWLTINTLPSYHPSESVLS